LPRKTRLTFVLGEVVVLDDIVGLGETATRKHASGISKSPFDSAPCDAVALT
jgi:hypothetical protein